MTERLLAPQITSDQTSANVRPVLCVCVCVIRSYQFVDLTLQVLDAVQLPLAAALGGDAVFAAAADVVNELQLL